MATQFTEIYKFIRVVLGDDDLENLTYPDETLQSHVEFYSAFKDSSSLAYSGAAFLADLSNKQKVLMSLEIAIGLVSTTPDYFSYKNPVLTVTRRSTNRDLIGQLRRQIDEVNGGFLYLKEDTEMWAWVNRWDRFWNEYDEIPVER